MAKFAPATKLSFLRILLSDIGRSYATSVRGAASTLADGVSDGGIPEVASHQQFRGAVGEKERVEEEKKAFWMRDPATGCWIPEDHFDDIDMAELRAKLLPSRK